MVIQDDASRPEDIERYVEPLESGNSRPQGTTPRNNYLPLENAWKTIRIVVLEVGTEKQKISCRMACVPLFGRLDYEAPSYTRRSPTSSYTIYMDHGGIFIWENLFKAIQALRFTGMPRYLWIDALCINQEDNQEKSLQLQRMRLVYQRASNVVIWLGEHKDDSKLGMKLLSDTLDGSPNEAHWLGLHRLVKHQ